MLQFHAELCCIESNVVHKVRRYVPLFVASELVSDVEGIIPHVASTNKKLICPQQSPLSSSQQAEWYLAEALYENNED